MNSRTVCRICMTEDVRLHCITNTHLQEMYERETQTLLTSTSDDKKPLLACIECCDRLQHCYQLSNGIEQTENTHTMMNLDPQLQTGQNIHQNNTCATLKYVEVCVKMEPKQLSDVEIKQESISDSENGMLQDNDIKLEEDDQSSDSDVGPEHTMILVELQQITTNEEINVSPVLKSENPKDAGQKKNDETRNIPEETSGEKAMIMESRQHQLTPHNDVPKPFECNFCKKRFRLKTSSYLNGHKCTHTGEKAVECEVCKKRFSNKSNLTKHARKHTNEKPFKCNVCKKCFSQLGDLSKHNLTHTGERPFECNICKKLYEDKHSLAKHVYLHSGVKPFECNVCKKRFSHSIGLSKHNLTHTGERAFECHICKKRFSTSYSLDRHFNIHSDVKPFECNVCQKRFSHSIGLSKHNLTHTGERPFECNICKKRFSTSYSLDRHLNIHSGVKPFVCNVCEERFSTKRDLTEHSFTHWLEECELN